MKQSILSLLVFLSVSTYAADAAIGLTLLSQGKFEEARQYIRRAYKENPNSPDIQYAYAKIETNGLQACDLYKSIADNKAASSSLRSKALYRLGCYYFAKEEYDGARKAFVKAEKLVPAGAVKHLKAMAIFNKGDNRAAELLWLETVSKEDNVKSANRARYYLGNAFYQQGKYEDAYNCFNKARESKKKSWAVAALAGACLAAYHSGNTVRSTILYGQIGKECPDLLEKELLKSIKGNAASFSEADVELTEDFGTIEATEPAKAKEVKPPPEPEKKKSGVFYTLQVGAFGSSENARKLHKKMKKDFGHVTIKEETVKGNVFHKVRIGRFTQEEEALTYGENHLRGKEIAFRVVKE